VTWRYRALNFAKVSAISVTNQAIYVGGDFAGAAGTAQSNFAVFSKP
jgi:hypothetical protein